MKFFKMKAILLLLFVSAHAYAGWEVNSGAVSNNIGTLLASCTQERSYYFVNTNSDKHLLLPYFGGAVDNLVDINLTQGSARITNTWPSRFPYHGAAYTNGVVYLFHPNSAYVAPNYVGKLVSYDLASGRTNTISNTYQHAGYFCDWGDDGWLYAASYGVSGSQLERYNPITEVFEQLGVIDTNNFVQGSAQSQYGYSLGADSRYCYVSIRDDFYYLGVYDTQTGVKTNFWWNLGDAAGSYIYRGKNGGWFYERLGGGAGDIGSARVWYALSNGVPHLIGTNASFYMNVYYAVGTGDMRGGVVTEALVNTSTGYNFDTGYGIPDSSNNVATIGYKLVEASSYTYVSVSNLSLVASNLRDVYDDGSTLFIIGGDYLPWLRYTHASATVTRIGSSGNYNMYDAIKVGERWYVSGYDAALFLHNPAQAWSLSPSTPDLTDESVNPRKLSLSIANSEMYPCMGCDNNLYVISYVSRNGAGAKLGWYNLTTEASGSSWPFQDSAHSPGDMQSTMGGTNLVFLPYGTDELLVFNVPTQSWARTNDSVLTGVTRLDKCVEVAHGIMVGVSGNNVWRYDVANNEVLFTNTLPGTAWSGFVVSHAGNQNHKKLCLGPDGYVWLTLGNDLYRLHPATCEPELIAAGVGPHNVMFNGGDAYLYNPGTPELHVLSDLLTYTAPPAQPTGTLRANKLVVRGAL
jgi:hypothetical protein